MSKTDKTRPYWVQVRDPDFPYKLKAWHRHYGTGWYNGQGCQIDFPPSRTRRYSYGNFSLCEWWPQYKDYDKIWGRSGYRRSSEFNQDGRARTDLRRLRSKWKKEINQENIDSHENLPTKRWLSRSWYWD
jgi:hypothetical protein